MDDHTFQPNKDPQPRQLSLTSWIAIGLLAGVGCGLFFGDYCDRLKWIGDAFVGLLQMSVLPYVALSLVVNVGGLSLKQGRRLLGTSMVVFVALWCIGLAMMLAMTYAFPSWHTGSFFSTSFVEEPDPPDWLELFIPSNPFLSLAKNAVPAVVIFSIGLGLALIGMPNKEALLQPLNVVVEALARLNKLVVSLSPLGLFGIAAYTAGTIDPQQFELIQGYLLTYGAAALVMCLIVLPGVVSACTPFSSRDVLRYSRDPMIAAFVIGNSFVVLPMIIEAVKKLYGQYSFTSDSETHSPEYLVPMAYPFPDVGRIVGLIFIPFAAWFYGTSIDPTRYPSIIGVGTLGAFGKPIITVPVLLNLAELPSDIFNLFITSGIVAARFGDLMKCMYLVAFTVLVSCAMANIWRPNWPQIVKSITTAALITVVCVAGLRFYLEENFKDAFAKDQLLTLRTLTFYDTDARPLSEQLVSSHVATSAQSAATQIRPRKPNETRVQRIKDERVLRIGFDARQLPFSYFNAHDQLVGLDVDMAHFLAYDLIDPVDGDGGIRIEFIPYDRSRLAEHLANDDFDIAISGIEGTVVQAATLPSIDPYLEVTLALVVPDHDKRQYQTSEQLRTNPDLKLAVVKNSFFAERVAKVLPAAHEKTVIIDAAEEYFAGAYEHVDGLVISAEAGSAWTLRYPKFTVTNPVQGRVRVPLYYLTANDIEFEEFLQNWLTLKRNDGTITALFDYWILGKDEQAKPRRWSVIRWLGWVD